ncbi:MAG: M13-type metalloendopeptidase [Bacteroidales bacterium]|nr:M13-type metalloendopeptidase [Bacteroidales bacterium]
MNKLIFYLPITFVVFSTGLQAADQFTDQSLNIANLDKTALPGTDFCRYATGGWMDTNPIPDEYSRYGSFDKLRENNQKQIKELIVEMGKTIHENGSGAQKIGDLYRMGTDSTKLNADGAAPIQSQLQLINAARGKADIIRLTAELRRWGLSPFLGMYIGADDKNSSMNILHLYQGGLGLEERDYYIQKNKDSKKLRAEYSKLIVAQFVNAGYSKVAARKASQSVMKIETALAVAHFEKEKTRVPELNYHKYSVSQLNDSVAVFDWKAFFDAAGMKGLKDLNVGQVEPIAAAVKLIENTPVNELKDYLSWCLINEAAGYLSDSFVHVDFDFFGKVMSGAKTIQPRWKRTVSTIDLVLGEEVGQLYVARYFPAQAKERMLKLVDNLKLSLGERIREQDWMSDETKAKALDKLSAFIVKIGYPDKWRDYTALEIKNDSYWDNILRSSAFEYNYRLDKLGKPVDKMEWLMTPQTVNAYYNPTTNEICFPAGILQAPFFYMNADDAVNYGAIGVVIGHEMTHGFDDQGCKYDKFGNMTNWWTNHDASQFRERTKVLEDYFSNIIVLNDVHANGAYTLGENIADHGGLQIACNAFMKTEQGKSGENMDGFTPQQRFFLAYANVWAGNVRDEEILRLTKLDSHSLGKWRINGALPHIDAWYDAFGIKAGDPMYLPKEKRASIW